MVGTNGIKEFLERTRDERIKRLDISALIIGMDGIKGAGKSTYQLPKLQSHLRGRNASVNQIRATSIFRSDKRKEYCEKMLSALEEDLDISLELYVADIKKAWEELTSTTAKREGIILLDRTPYTTLAIQLTRRGLQPNSREARDLVERIFQYPIVPPHIEIITVCTPEIALDRKKGEKIEKDTMSQYYKVAYAVAHEGAQAGEHEMQLWWLNTTKKMYETLFRSIPNVTLVHTGRKSEDLNTEIKRVATRAYEKYKREREN